MNYGYGFADVGRNGLANMLLPWARCEVFCHLHQIPMLAPQWTQLKVGPLLRGERDKRYYWGLFDNSSYVRGLRRWWLLATCQRVTEAPRLSSSTDLDKSIYVFKGLGRYFADLAGHSEYLHKRLTGILSKNSSQALRDSRPDRFIAVHIRRGDKPPLEFGMIPPAKTMHWAIPTEWYVRCIKQVQRVYGKEIPVIIFTDAQPGQISEVLKLPGVRLAPPNPAIVDLLLMARACVLITSGSSTFSMWSSFFGEMPSIWFPSQWREQTNWKHPEFECYTDLQGNVPQAFIQLLEKSSLEDQKQ